MNVVDITGKRFGHLTAIRAMGSTPTGQMRWLCQCDCGGTKVVSGVELRYGKHARCGACNRGKIPSWATDAYLRQLLLLPALRKVDIVRRYFRLSHQRKQIARETGLTVCAINAVLGRIRQQMGKDDDIRFSRSTRKRFDIFGEGEEHEGYRVTHAHGRIKRIPVWAFDDARLQRVLLEPSMVRYRIAALFFVEHLPAKEVAKRTGLSEKSVHDFVCWVREVHAHPLRRRIAFVLPVTDGKLRFHKRNTE